MTDSDPPRVSASVSVPITPGGGIYITGGVSMDDVFTGSTPSSLATKPGEQGAKTEWDVTSLDAAVTWLTAHADYLDRMYRGMDDIKTLMDGPDIDNTTRQDAGSSQSVGTGGPLGGFKGAGDLAATHKQLYQGVNTSLKTIVENLYDAADALKKIKEKYSTAENANAMSAADMEKIFGDLGTSEHDV